MSDQSPSASPGPAQPLSENHDVAVEDWLVLFHAVTLRLRMIGGDLPTDHAVTPESAPQTQAAVRECAAALVQLHDTLVHELARCRQLEQALQEARRALDPALAAPIEGAAPRPAAGAVRTDSSRPAAAAAMACPSGPAGRQLRLIMP